VNEKTLYERLGGYDAISAVANDLLPHLQEDPLERVICERQFFAEKPSKIS